MAGGADPLGQGRRGIGQGPQQGGGDLAALDVPLDGPVGKADGDEHAFGHRHVPEEAGGIDSGLPELVQRRRLPERPEDHQEQPIEGEPREAPGPVRRAPAPAQGDESAQRHGGQPVA